MEEKKDRQKERHYNTIDYVSFKLIMFDYHDFQQNNLEKLKVSTRKPMLDCVSK